MYGAKVSTSLPGGVKPCNSGGQLLHDALHLVCGSVQAFNLASFNTITHGTVSGRAQGFG